MDDDSRLKTQLAPLEGALLSAAREQAAARLREAEARAKATTNEGATRARSLIEEATAEGERAAEREASRRLVEARRQARTAVLGAQRAAYDRLVSEAVTQAEALRKAPEYRDLERSLVAAAKTILGAEAKIVRNPDSRAGVQAQSGNRFVDLTLATLARRCVERLGAQVTQLWA